MNTFKLMISAYNSILYNGPVIYCGITTLDGSLGIKARHEPILSILEENSFISYKNTEGMDGSIQITSGMLSFNKNQCTIIVDAPGKTKNHGHYIQT